MRLFVVAPIHRRRKQNSAARPQYATSFSEEGRGPLDMLHHLGTHSTVERPGGERETVRQSGDISLAVDWRRVNAKVPVGSHEQGSVGLVPTADIQETAVGHILCELSNHFPKQLNTQPLIVPAGERGARAPWRG